MASPLFCDINGILMNGCHSGHLRLRSERNLACPAGAQEGRHQGFHPLVNHPFPKRAQWLFRTETIKERQRIFSSAGRTMCVHVSAYSQCQIPYCYTCGLLYAACGITVPHKSLIWILQTAPANYAYHVLFTLNPSLFQQFSILHFQFSILHTEIDNQNFHKNRVRPHSTVRTLLFT